MKKDIKQLPLSKYMILTTAIIFALLSCVFMPLYVSSSSNVIMSVTAIPEIIKAASDLFEIVAFALCYSIIIFAAMTYSTKKAVSLSVIYVSACVLRRVIDLLITFILNSYIASDDILSVVFYLLMETAQVAFVLLVAIHVAKNYQMRRAELKKAARHLGSPVKVYAIDFDKVYSGSNPMHRIMLSAGVMLSIIRILSRIRYDIFYGAPTSTAEIITMVVYYLFDIFVCIGFYAISWFVLSKMHEMNKKLSDQ